MVARYEDLQRQTEADAQDVIAIRSLLLEVITLIAPILKSLLDLVTTV